MTEDDWSSWLWFGIAVVVSLVAAFVIAAIVRFAVTSAARRREWPRELTRRVRWPFRLTLFALGLWIAVNATLPKFAGREAAEHLLLIATIIVVTWLVCQSVLFALWAGTNRFRIDVVDNRYARKVRTQVIIVSRLVVVAAVVIGAGAILLSFPSVRVVGASVLASAGLVSVIAALAAQSTLANVFAGIQLAFSEAIRVDDVVVVEGEWGRIGEITLSYVVVNLWDERNLVLPCTYFTTQPFESWTREGSRLLGAVEFDLDWRVSPAEMREELGHILERTDLWDHRASVLQVTDAVGGYVRVRILVTADDAPTLFDLRCHVREEMVDWLQRHGADGLPLHRVAMVDVDQKAATPAKPTKSTSRRQPVVEEVPDDKPIKPEEGRNLFSGSVEAEERASQFTSAIPIIHSDDYEASDDHIGRGEGDGEGGGDA